MRKYDDIYKTKLFQYIWNGNVNKQFKKPEELAKALQLAFYAWKKRGCEKEFGLTFEWDKELHAAFLWELSPQGEKFWIDVDVNIDNAVW